MPAAGVLGGPFWVEVASGWEWVTRRIRLQKLYYVVVVVWRVVTRAPGNLISIYPFAGATRNNPTLLAFSLGFHWEAAAPGSWLKSSF